MAFTEDLSPFFDVDDGFAVEAEFARGATLLKTCNVIFDDPTHEVSLYEQGVEERAPTLRAKSADVATIKRGDIATVNAVDYRVERIHADGTGITIIYLAKG